MRELRRGKTRAFIGSVICFIVRFVMPAVVCVIECKQTRM